MRGKPTARRVGLWTTVGKEGGMIIHVIFGKEKSKEAKALYKILESILKQKYGCGKIDKTVIK